MKNQLKQLRTYGAMALTAVVMFGTLFSSCYTKDYIPYVPPTSQDPAKYTATITVLDDNMAGIAGVTFQGLTPAPSGGAAGVYTFTPTSGGTYQYVATKAGFSPTFGTISFPQGNNGDVIAATSVVMMKAVATPEPAKYQVNGLVIKGGTANEAINGASVTCTLRGGAAVAVTVTGNTFTPAITTGGIYDFVISQADYETVAISQTIQSIAAGESLVLGITIPMYPKGTVGGLTYSISGLVMNVDQQIIAKPGKVFVSTKANGTTSTQTINIINGSYSVANLPKGDVSLVFEVEGMQAQQLQFSLSQFSAGTIIPVNVYMAPPASGENAKVVEQGKEVTIVVPPTIAVPGESVSVETNVHIPAATVIKDAAGVVITEPIVISIETSTVIQAAVTPEEQIATTPSASFIVGTFGPAGISFATPIKWEVTSPFASTQSFDSLDLQWFNAATGVWVSQNQTVSLVGNKYIANISHFSKYRLAAKASTAKVEDNETVEKPFYTDKVVSNATYTYTTKTGTKSLVNAQQALTTAGITPNTDLAKIMTEGVESIVGKSAYAEATATNKTGMALTPEQVLNTTTVYTTTTYVFTFKVAGKNVMLKASNTVTKTNAKVEVTGDHHHTTGDHVTDGGAGGGTGGNL